eukprot:GHVQ01033188.1.p1 GENE.GHVQ01033188.1~~GHVQ01033188.1.p1  ORF type:complete len:852 (-),score=66.74 GHVQ01033188.1:255-2810(-)
MAEVEYSQQPVRRTSTLLSGFQRLTSRAQLIRQSSAAILRVDTTPSLLRKSSGITLYPETDRESDVEFFYYSGWSPPYLHFRQAGGTWTSVPGVSMTRAQDVSMLPKFEKDIEPVWVIRIPTSQALEVVPNDNGRSWDKAPGNNNYFIEGPGRYFLRNGKIEALVEPPEKPALIRADEVGSSHVSIVWNPPIILPSVVTSYRVYRDDKPIATVEGDVTEYRDDNLMGLMVYRYRVKALNKLNQEGPPSDECAVRTGEPGKPSAPRALTCLRHSSSSIVLSWSVPVYHGGAPIKYYRVYRNSVSIAVVPAVTDVAQTWTDENVETGAEYKYSVSACHHRPAEYHAAPPSRNFTMSHAADATPTTRAPDEDDSVPPALLEAQRGSGLIPDSVSDTKPQRMSSLATISETMLAHPVGGSPRGPAHPVGLGAPKGDEPYEGVQSDSIEVKAVQMLELPRLHDGKTHILLQTFNWNSAFNPNGWHKILMSKVNKMAECNITMAWLGPPSESVSAQGYMPTRWYNMTSCYGTSDELLALNRCLRDIGITPMVDLVINHRCGTKQDSKGQWTIYEDPPWESWAIVSNNLQGYEGRGAQDSGEQSECAPDIDHENSKVREDVKEWISWMFKEIGFGAVRIDMAPGYNVRHQVDYIKHLGCPFAVGEYWNGNAAVLQNYAGGGQNVIGVYDFALYYTLRHAVESGDFGALNDNGKINGFLGRDPQKAVTFIDNHDTEHLDFVGKFAGGNCEAVLRGYAFLLTHPGTPCLYWNHWADYGDKSYQQIKDLCNLRKQQRIHSGSGVHIAKSEHGLYAAFVSSDRHCGYGGGSLAVKIGSHDWHPGGGGWQTAAYGDQYCVWIK